MNKAIAIISAAVIIGGLSTTADAHARPAKGAAALSGVQSWSLQISAVPTQAPLLNPYEKSTIGVSGLFDHQAVYQQINSDTNLTVSPVKGDRELLDTVNAGDTGNNRVQVLYQAVQ